MINLEIIHSDGTVEVHSTELANVSDVSALDLQSEIKSEIDADYTTMQVLRGKLSTGEHIECVIFGATGRVGVFMGGDSLWGDLHKAVKGHVIVCLD